MLIRALLTLLVASACASVPRGAEVMPAAEETSPEAQAAAWGTAPSPPLPSVPSPLPVPEALSEELRTALTTALEHGAPDPRHGTPHEVEVFDSSVWNTEPETRRAIGFVLPHAPGERPFAIVGDLLYPLVSLGPAVDLRAACAETVSALERLGTAPTMEEAGGDRSAWFDARDAAWERCPGLHAALVLASTDAPLAAAIARAAYRTVEGEQHSPTARGLLVNWMRSAFERAVTAHMRGDDRLARQDARSVARLLPIVEGMVRDGEGDEDEDALARLRYLHVADDLARDQDRRASAGRRHPLPELPEEGEIDPALVPLLIEHLDEVQVGQFGQPGGVPLNHSPIVSALIRAGAPAVPALIDVLEHDRRLTRSVHFWRDFAPPRTVIGVHEAAYAALIAILGVSFFEPVATGDSLTSRGDDPRAALAVAMREYWERYGQHPPVERRFRVLADNEAPADQQVEAAAWLTSPAGQYAPQGSMVQPVWVGLPPGPLAGEPLRSRRDPSLTQILARRMDAGGGDREGFSRSCAFAEALSTWAPAEAPALLTRFARRCIPEAQCGCAPSLVSVAGEHEPALITAYARRLRTVREEVEGYLLSPIVRFPDHPAIRQLVDWLFETGPFMPSAEDAWRASRTVRLIVESGAFEVPAVRRHLARALEVTLHLGTLTSRDGYGWVEYGSGGFSVELPEPVTAARPVRVCDLYAHHLAPVLSVPFSLGWDDERRRAAIARMRAELSR